jgi:hypothetical protein
MELSPPRMFICARCQTLVLICSRCDRGRIYGGPACSSASRTQNHRAAERRYQQSRKGRFTHAARSRRYRLRRQAQQIVTDQGSPPPVPDVPLRVAAGIAAQPRRQASSVTAMGRSPICFFCGAPTREWVRRGFLRRRA